MEFSEFDHNLIERCLARTPGAWEEFVNRFLGVVIHVVNQTAQCKSIRLSTADRDDLVAEAFLAFIDDDFQVLRRFRGASTLATYLTVIARRVVVRELLQRKSPARVQVPLDESEEPHRAEPTAEDRIGSRDEVERILSTLDGREADVVRLYHLEGKSYREISRETGVPENSIGPTLTRARAKLRAYGPSS